jgi:cell division septal protein FtsQ
MSFPDAIDLRRVRVPRPSFRRISNVRFRRPSRLGALIAIVLIALIAAASWFLLRDSSLVQVREVKVVGLSGYYDKNARRAVIEEAQRMTTMNFDANRIEEAAGQFVSVAGVTAKTDFPHGVVLTIDVRRPVLVAKINGRTVTLSQNGEIMTAAQSTSTLPRIEAAGTIDGNRVTGGRALGAAKLLGAAPDVLLRKVDEIRWGKLGLMVTLNNGPVLYFGDSSDVDQKWRDAAAVLASPQAHGAAYLDLRSPGRPAIGGLGAAPATLSTAPTETLPEQAVSAATDDAATAEPATTEPGTQTQAPAETQTTTPTQAPAQTTPPAQTPPAAAGGASPNG